MQTEKSNEITAQDLFNKKLEAYKLNELTKLINKKAKVEADYKKELESIKTQEENVKALTSLPDTQEINKNYFTLPSDYWNSVHITTTGSIS